MKNKISCMGILFTASITLLTGCGSRLPEMTDVQEEIIGEYAAELLLKYDINHRSRLVKLEMETEPQEENPTEEIIPSSETKEEDNWENTSVIPQEQEIAQEMQISIEQQLAFPDGVRITYQGEQVINSYPEEGTENSFFSLDATEGKKLLVLKFRLENQSQSEAAIDVFSQQKKFAITINGNVTRYALTTLLLDDLSCYMGKLSAGEGVDTVLIAELDEALAQSVTSISLSIKGENGNTSLLLK